MKEMLKHGLENRPVAIITMRDGDYMFIVMGKEKIKIVVDGTRILVGDGYNKIFKHKD